MNKMAQFQSKSRGCEGQKRPVSSNVKSKQKYERFGETIRYLTFPEWQRFLEYVEVFEHKLMMRVIYELGCRVGEFVRIRLGDIDFVRGRVFFPKQNTKTGVRRVSFLPRGLANDLKSWLKQNGRMTIRGEQIRKLGQCVFSPRVVMHRHVSNHFFLFGIPAEVAGVLTFSFVYLGEPNRRTRGIAKQ